MNHSTLKLNSVLILQWCVRLGFMYFPQNKIYKLLRLYVNFNHSQFCNILQSIRKLDFIIFNTCFGSSLFIFSPCVSRFLVLILVCPGVLLNLLIFLLAGDFLFSFPISNQFHYIIFYNCTQFSFFYQLWNFLSDCNPLICPKRNPSVLLLDFGRSSF